MISAQRRMRGQMAFHAGHAAEFSVARHYEALGYRGVEARWRGAGGEIDLIMQDPSGLVFVEVKKSIDFDAAASMLAPRQMRRLFAAAEEYLGQQPLGTLSAARFDVALVDGTGQVHIIENALGAL